MSPFEDHNGLRHVAEIKKEQNTQYMLGDVIAVTTAPCLLTGEDARPLLTWLGFQCSAFRIPLASEGWDVALAREGKHPCLAFSLPRLMFPLKGSIPPSNKLSQSVSFSLDK